MAITGEPVENLVLLAWGEKARPGVEHTVSLVQGVGGTPAPVVEFLLDAPAALIESITGKAHDMEGIHDRPHAGEFFDGGTLKAGESSIATISMRSRHVLGWEAS